MIARAAAALTSSLLVASLGPPLSAADVRVADVCLEVAGGVVSESEWLPISEAIAAAIVSRLLLFPEPAVMAELPGRFDIWSGHEGFGVGSGAPCVEPGVDWTARFSRDFLEAGADLSLARAPTTPGIGSDVTIEWYPDETRLRTTLVFAGPLDIPNGTCWVDDVLSVDAATGTVVASAEQGVKTSPFAESACRRFFDHLPDGGAGEQVVTLLPTSIELGDGGVLRFVAAEVVVRDDAVIVAGELRR